MLALTHSVIRSSLQTLCFSPLIQWASFCTYFDGLQSHAMLAIMYEALGLPRFGSELWSGPEPSRTGLKFGPGFRVGAEPDRRSRSRFGVGPNLAEPFRTRSGPRTENKRWLQHKASGSASCPHAEQAHVCEKRMRHNRFGFCESPEPVPLMFIHVASMCTQQSRPPLNVSGILPPLS